jgi:hypothetical protein
MNQQRLVRPAGLGLREPKVKRTQEPAASWFVAVNPFVDPAQLTARRMPKWPATWTQSWTQARAPVQY